MVEDVVNGCSTSTLISISIGDGSGSPHISSVALALLPHSSTIPIGYGKGCYFMTGCNGANCYQ